MITVVLAVSLLGLGLAVLSVDRGTVREVVAMLPVAPDIQQDIVRTARRDETGWLLTLAAPLLLIAGSLLPGL